MKGYTLITGASSGIGYELAKIYAQQGENLILVARRQSALQRLQQDYPHIEWIELDLAVPENAKKLFEITEQKGWFISRLINNAGVGVFGEFSETDLGREIAMVNLNIQALMILTKCYLQPMKQRNQGEILNVSSVAGFMPGPQMSVYYATKAFVNSFSQALHYELRKTNIRVSILAPGTTATEFEKTANLQNSQLFNRLKVQSAKEVAMIATQQLGKNVIFTNQLNKFLVWGSRFIPNRWLVKIVAEIQKKKT